MPFTSSSRRTAFYWNSVTLLLAAVLWGHLTARSERLPEPDYFRGDALRIGNQVQLLADDYIVEDRWKLERRVGTVVKHLGNPVIVQDKPWEGALGGFPSVVFDEQTRKYRMYYDNFNLTHYFAPKPGYPSYYVGYAESEDGIRWVKPEMEAFPFAGFPRTNIVAIGLDGRRANAAQVILNPDQSNPDKRFIVLYIGGGLRLAYSADGLVWRTESEPIIKYHTDTMNHLVYVAEHKRWHLYLRPSLRSNGHGALPEGNRHTGRRVALAMSEDLKAWTQPRTIFYPDERDEPDYDQAVVFRRHGLFMAMYSQMTQESGKSETQVYLATSRDGIHFERTWDRKPFIPRGPSGAFDHGQVSVGNSPPIERGEEMFMYYYASPEGQHSWYKETSVGLVRFRKDRFIGQWAGKDTGYLLTRQFVLEGNRLLLNCTALPIPYHQRGVDGIRVAIIEAPDYLSRETTYEKAISGFGLDECDSFTTDHTGYVVSWNGSADLSALRGKNVYLRFQLRNAGLYGFQIAP